MYINRVIKKDFFSFILVILVMATIYAIPDKNHINIIIRLFFILIMGIKYFNFKIKENANVIFFLWSFLFIVMCFFNTLISADIKSSLIVLITVIQSFAVVYLLYCWVKTKNKLIFLFKTIIILDLVLCIRTLLNLDFSRFGFGKIGYIMGVNSNALAIRFTFAFLISLYLYYLEAKKNKIIYMISIVFNLTLILITGSRRALIITFFCYAIFMFKKSTDISKILKNILLILMGIVIIYQLIIKIPELYNIIGSRIQSSMQGFFSSDSSVLGADRTDLIEVSIQLYIKKPIFGWGIGSFSVVSGSTLPYSHNNYVELLFATGIIGFLIYYSIYIYILKKIKFLKIGVKLDDCLLTIIFVALLLSDIASCNYSSIVTISIIAIAIKIIYLSDTEIRRVDKHYVGK